MIDVLIENALARNAVRLVTQSPDGFDEYHLDRAGDSARVEPPVAVHVRPDGRFSRAEGGSGLLSIGQVATLCGL